MTSRSDAHFWRETGRDQGGFTLLELIVVISIMSIMLLFAPRIMAGIDRIRLDIATEKLVGVLRSARSTAIQSGTTMTVEFDCKALTYRMDPSGVAIALPQAIAKLDCLADARTYVRREPAVIFFADGTASADPIVLHSVRNIEHVSVVWLTGRVLRYD